MHLNTQFCSATTDLVAAVAQTSSNALKGSKCKFRLGNLTAFSGAVLASKGPKNAKFALISALSIS